MKRLLGKTAIVTGVGRGIGKGIARRFLQEGARVLVVDIVPERVQAVVALQADGEVAGIVSDISQRRDVEAIVEAAVQRWGCLDVLVNCAGVARMKPFLDLTDEEWDHTMNVNLRGTFIGRQVAARQMIAQGTGGAIVNIGSTNGLRGQARHADYNASKAGIINLGMTLAVELADHNIRVNTVCPGSIWTELSVKAGWTEEQWDRFRNFFPLRRFGTPADIAAACAYLASDDSSFVTGHALCVDGGLLAVQFPSSLL